MRTRLAGGITALLGVLVLRVVLSGESATFVNRPVTILLGLAGAVMVALGGWAVVGRRAPGHGHEHGQTVLWPALLLPVLLLGIVAPWPLGSYVVERSAPHPPPSASVQKVSFPPLAGDPAELTLEDFWRRSVTDHGASLAGHTVVMTGFVSGAPSADGSWAVARLRIWCCAADAMPFQAQVRGVPAPADGQWVRVTGTALPADAQQNAQLTATAVQLVPEPQDPYLR